MKRRSTKKGHAHGGKHHKHKTNSSKNDQDIVRGGPAHAPDAAAGDVTLTSTTISANEPRRGSMCEYCGAGSVLEEAGSPDGFDEDSFDCADDCERFALVDVNAVACMSAYQLRSPHLTAFYCQCGALLSEIHALVRLVGGNPTSGDHSVLDEQIVAKIQPKILALFAKLHRLGVGNASSLSSSLSSLSSPLFDQDDEDDGNDPAPPKHPTCPFVMVLSVLLPTLHKLLHWTQLTKPHWWLCRTGSGSPSQTPTELLLAQLQLHDLLTAVVAEGSRLAQLMAVNEERDQDIARLLQPQPQPHTLTSGRSGGYSSSSSSSSLALSTQSGPGATDDRGATLARLPQIRKISFEFEEWLAETKFELAELSEAMVENVEIMALQLSRFPYLGSSSTTPINGPPAPKAKSSGNEFVKLMIQHVLTPLNQRVVASPSISRSYIFPRLVDRCISVAIDEFVVENGKWNQLSVSQFESAIELLRSWGLETDADYDKKLIAAPREVARLSLLSMDAFRRLDILLHTWLRTGKDGEPYVARLTLRTNLENIRTTLKKTMTARSDGSVASSSFATPPPRL